jgi:CO/xanthine dehydrogenase Mo-binding subunit
MGIAMSQKWAIDPQWGVNLTKRLEAAKPPTIMDLPLTFQFAAVNLPDPQNPVGAKGIGEPLMGCATAALLCAISDALGGHYFNRTPVVTDMIVNALHGRAQPSAPLAANSQ